MYRTTISSGLRLRFGLAIILICGTLQAGERDVPARSISEPSVTLLLGAGLLTVGLIGTRRRTQKEALAKSPFTNNKGMR
jgi:hypothetical protein